MIEWCYIGSDSWSPGLPTPGEFARGSVWVHALRPLEDATLRHLEELVRADIHEEHRVDALNQQHSPFYDYFEHGGRRYELLIVAEPAPAWEGPASLAAGNIERPIAMLVFGQLLITIADPESLAIRRLRGGLAAHWDDSESRSVDALVMHVAGTATNAFLRLRSRVARRIAALERELLQSHGESTALTELSHLMELCRRLQALAELQEEVLESWGDSDPARIHRNEQLRVLLTDRLEHTRRLNRFAERQNSRLDGLLQIHLGITSKQSAEVMQRLTVVTAIFLPLGLVAGLLGMNVPVPGERRDYAFFWVLLFLLLAAISMLLYFRRKGWF